MKALYLHGFLGGPKDMSPFFLEGVESHSVDLRTLVLKTKSQKSEELLDSGPYDFAVGYSFGGRVLAKLLEENPKFVKKPVFCSARVTPYTREELEKREDFKKDLLSRLNSSSDKFLNDDFSKYWAGLELFGGHSMNDFRKEFNISHKPWNIDEIKHYLESHFTYETPKLSGFIQASIYIHGELDSKYKKESEKLDMKTYEFEGLGHRFLYEDPKKFKSFLKNKVALN